MTLSDPGQYILEIGSGFTPLSFAVWTMVYMAAARWPPISEPSEEIILALM
jgi:hypothetical protein